MSVIRPSTVYAFLQSPQAQAVRDHQAGANTDALTTKEKWELARAVIQHEDGLMHQRFTWLLGINGFMFAGVVVGLSTVLQHQSSPYAPFYCALLFVISSLSAIPPIKIRNKLLAANRHVQVLRMWWESHGLGWDRGKYGSLGRSAFPPIIGQTYLDEPYDNWDIKVADLEPQSPSKWWPSVDVIIIVWTILAAAALALAVGLGIAHWSA